MSESKSIHYDSLNEIQKKLVDTYIKSFLRNGAALEGTKRDQFDNVNKELTNLQVQFLSNVNEDTSHIILSKDELKGIRKFLENSKKIQIRKKNFPYIFPEFFHI